jgi:cellulose biosynthesis protein BcsQ
MRTIAIANQKGGCGKTTTAINLAVALARMGNRVIIVDLDPQACATQALLGEPDAARATIYHPLVNPQILMSQVAVPTSVENVDLVPSNVSLAGAEMELIGKSGRELRLAQAFKAVRDQYQACVIDCPPSLSVLTLNALVASTDVVVPIQADAYALRCAQRLLETVLIIRQRFHRYCAGNLRILMTCVEDRTTLGRRVQQQMRELFGELVLKTVIHRTVTLAEALAVGQAAVTYAPTSTAATEYMNLADELMGEVGEPMEEKALMAMAATAQSALGSREADAERPATALAPYPSRPIPEQPNSWTRERASAPEEPTITRHDTPDRTSTPLSKPPTPTARPEPEEPPVAVEPGPQRRTPAVRSRRGARRVILGLFFLIVLAAIVAGAFYGLGMMNKPPVANSGSVTGQEDTPLSIILAGTDRDQNPLTFRVVDGPSHGELSGTPPAIVYTPAPNYNGPDSLTFVANDGKVDSQPATIVIAVGPANDAPVADDQSAKVEDNKSAAIALTASDIDGDRLKFSIVDQPQHGTLKPGPEFARDGKVLYVPRGRYAGPDSFTFQVSDGAAESRPATVSMTVVHVNSPPVATDSELTTPEDTPAPVTLTASDADKDPLTYTVTKGPEHGTLEGAAPKLQYVPKANFNGTDTFTYEVRDGQGGTAAAAVSIKVTSVNDAPSIQSEPAATHAAAGRQYVYDVNATDPDAGDVLTYALVEKPEGMSIDPSRGRIQWMPTEGQMGTHKVVVEVADNATPPASSRQSFDITVAAPTQEKTILTVSGGYDQKTQKPLPANDSRVQASDEEFCRTDAGSYTVYKFTSISIPVGTRIMSVVLYVNHFEELQFPAGKLEWRVGTGWPGSSSTWASMTPSVYEGQRNKGAISWDIKGVVDTPEKINALQLQIKNNCTSPQKATFLDHAYVVVLWQ